MVPNPAWEQFRDKQFAKRQCWRHCVVHDGMIQKPIPAVPHPNLINQIPGRSYIHNVEWYREHCVCEEKRPFVYVRVPKYLLPILKFMRIPVLT